MVSSRPVISKSFSSWYQSFCGCSKTPITIGIIVTFMFHSFFNSLARSRCLSFFSLSFNFTRWSAGTAKSTAKFSFFFFADYYKVWLSGWDYYYYYYYYNYFFLLQLEILLLLLLIIIIIRRKWMQQISTEGVSGETRLGRQGDSLGNVQEIEIWPY